jgi:hypothetical protein
MNLALTGQGIVQGLESSKCTLLVLDIQGILDRAFPLTNMVML